MVNYTDRLDNALRKAAWAHEKQDQHRKGSDIPYIIHPFGVMIIASNTTDNEDILIACLLHDVLEDVGSSIYNENMMLNDFGEHVVAIVKDVTKDENATDWRKRSEAYLHHLEFVASDDAVIVSASDKIHNLLSILVDYQTYGDELWDRFKTKSKTDQLWWYESILGVVKRRNVSEALTNQLNNQVETLKARIQTP
jgi:(p)ppGpp synthase/HD superfamily hydrolase